MLALLDRLIALVLIVVHVGLLLWAAAGLAELFLPSVPWPSLENPLFPFTVLLLQWISILIGAVAYLLGYALRWRYLAKAMIAVYAFMGAVCAIETFAFLTHASRFVEMGLEYATYAAIVVYLHMSPAIRRRIGPREQVAVA